MRKLNSGDVNRGLKKGWGINDFLEKFNIYDEEALLEELGNVYVKGPVVNNVIRKMRKNDKKVASGSNAKHQTLPIENTQNDCVLCVNPLVIEEAGENNKVAEEKTKVQVEAIPTAFESKKDKKLSCEKQLNEAQEILVCLEKERKSLIRENQDISCQIAEYKENIERWLVELKRQQEELKGKILMLTENKAKLSENSEKMAGMKKTINELEEEIFKMTEVVVYIGTKNEVEANYKLSEEISAISSAEVKEKMTILLENDENDLLDEFSVGQTKNLAKILLLLDKALKVNDKSQIVIMSDDEDIITTWLQLNEWKVKTM